VVYDDPLPDCIFDIAVPEKCKEAHADKNDNGAADQYQDRNDAESVPDVRRCLFRHDGLNVGGCNQLFWIAKVNQ